LFMHVHMCVCVCVCAMLPMHDSYWWG